ncbi:MAG TPA: AMP-binding protein [Noviherbaspirillum sp.]|uniref:class I adenylate-forming enzyme family protein n=1 Tax=Noviherbaspirillum sp. TaxID=1926288 RepID=UPI002B47BCD8|nr:AMP-binding protein [Noviherbaspirillum sp.]HJV87760.1 AMP-binding protein [Noviherbaspirillum sp.]
METGFAQADLVRMAAQLTIPGLFRQQVMRHPERIALEDGKRSLSYGELNQRVNRLANALTARGVRHGDRIAILAENRIEYIELEMAVAKLGAILACQNWRQSDEELQHCIRLVSPRVVVASERHAPALGRIEHGVKTVITLERDYEAMLAEAASDEPVASAPLDPEDGLIILYTSGTTGLPKGALISQRAMVARGNIHRVDGLLKPGDTFIAWAPLFHMVSTDQCYSTLTTGGKVIVMDGLDVTRLVDIVSREEIGHLTLIPGMVDRVIDELRRTGIKAKGIRTIGCMADLVPRDQIAQATTLLQAPFLNSFGSTETGVPPASRGAIPIGVLPQKLSKEQSSNCIIRLVDEDDNEVPDGSPGELTIRTPALFSGYWGAPEATAKDFRNGWFHMGDVFVRNADGTLDYVDRRKYLIKSGGENIYPAEIERVLLAHPSIADAAVVRRKDARWGEVPVAFIVKADAALSSEEVIEACRGKVANYKLPKDVIFIKDEDVPRSTTGKIKRHELEQVLDGAATGAACA